MTLLLSSNAALAQHGRVLRIAAILPLHCRNSVQTAAAASTCKVPPVDCCLHPINRNCTVMTLLSSNAALAPKWGRATPLPPLSLCAVATLSRQLLQMMPVDYCHLLVLGVFKNTEQPGSFLLQPFNHLAHSRACRDAQWCCRFLSSLAAALCPGTCCRCSCWLLSLAIGVLKSMELPGGFLLQAVAADGPCFVMAWFYDNIVPCLQQQQRSLLLLSLCFAKLYSSTTIQYQAYWGWMKLMVLPKPAVMELVGTMPMMWTSKWRKKNWSQKTVVMRYVWHPLLHLHRWLVVLHTKGYDIQWIFIIC